MNEILYLIVPVALIVVLFFRERAHDTQVRHLTDHITAIARPVSLVTKRALDNNEEFEPEYMGAADELRIQEAEHNGSA